ncbi:unnamed protein product [marine sediment metagenome]|uniref:Uncharacterized protein n=1 Tax=marine sediment metagenome TaxID=412755 RepID=X1Q459_9ZZZZ
MEIDLNVVMIVIVSTLSSIYGASKYYVFRASENRKQREHLQSTSDDIIANDFLNDEKFIDLG